MAWPTNKPDSNKFSSDNSSIKESRPELNTMSQAVNDIVDFVDTTNIAQNYILMYNASNGRLEPAEFSATTTISQDSAGGPFVINASGGLNAVVDDTSPELGGDLEVGDFLIKSTDIDSGGESAVRIRINTAASYRGIFAETDSHAGPPSPSSNTFAVSNNGDISLNNREASVAITLAGDNPTDVSGAGFTIVDSGSHATVNGINPGTGIGHRIDAVRNADLKIIAESDRDLSLKISTGTGKIKMYDAYTFPTGDGSAGQVLQTNGLGALSFATISSGGITDINAGINMAVSSPDSAGGVEVAMSSTWNNPINVNDQVLSNAGLKGYSETIYTSGGTTGTLTPAVSDGNVQTITLTGNITINGLSGVANGDSVTMIIRQPSSGGPYTLSSTMKFAGGTKTLSTTANAIDVLSIFYDGTDYLASLSTNFS